jgi:hypothetical protein
MNDKSASPSGAASGGTEALSLPPSRPGGLDARARARMCGSPGERCPVIPGRRLHASC